MKTEKEIEEMPSLYFNEYFKRKPDRLSEREKYNLFTMKPSNSNCVEYVFADPLRQEIQMLNQKIAELESKFKEIKGISLHRNEKDFFGTLDFLKSKISDDLYWELIGEDSEKYIYIAYLYQFKHDIRLKDIVDELKDIHETIAGNFTWLYEELRDKK